MSKVAKITIYNSIRTNQIYFETSIDHSFSRNTSGQMEYGKFFQIKCTKLMREFQATDGKKCELVKK